MSCLETLSFGKTLLKHGLTYTSSSCLFHGSKSEVDGLIKIRSSRTQSTKILILQEIGYNNQPCYKSASTDTVNVCDF